MAGISMCNSETCPVRETCKRHPESGTEADPHWQNWISVRPENVGRKCVMYVEKPKQRPAAP